MKLVYTATGIEVKVGDVIDYVHHNAPEGTAPAKLFVCIIEKPRSPGSTGRVYTKPVGAPDSSVRGVFPGVYDMDWIERDDRN